MDNSRSIIEYIKNFCPRKRSRSPNREENFVRLPRKPMNSYSPFKSAHKSTIVLHPDTHYPYSPKYLLRALSDDTRSVENLQRVLKALTQVKKTSDRQLEIISQQIYKVRKNNGTQQVKESGFDLFLEDMRVVGITKEEIKNLWEKVQSKDDTEFFAQVYEVRLVYLDAKSLRMGKEVNDEIIDAYINLIRKEEDVHIFKTHFFQYLETMNQTVWNTQELFKIISDLGLEKITDKNYLIIPANISPNHWVVLLINNKTKTIEYYDSLGTRSMEKICGIIEKFLEALDIEPYDWEGMEVPRQQNSYESWIFALKTVQALAGNFDFRFNAENIQYYKKIMLAELRDGKVYVE